MSRALKAFLPRSLTVVIYEVHILRLSFNFPLPETDKSNSVLSNSQASMQYRVKLNCLDLPSPV